jgi:hypothetical protein
MSNLVGQQFGNYRLMRLLGQGGFADTYWVNRCMSTRMLPLKSCKRR